MDVKCDKCDREFSDQPNEYPTKVHYHKGEYVCEDCLIGMGALPTHEKAADNQLDTEYIMYLTQRQM